MDSNNKYKIMHFTHNDSDAVGCDVLIRLAYETMKECEIETEFSTNTNIDDNINKYLDKGIDNNLIMIYITDIAIKEETAERLEVLRSKGVEIHLFDHHITNTLCHNYPWAEVTSFIVTPITDYTCYKRKVSATFNLYNYMIANDILDFTKVIDKFANDISDYDTWEWKNVTRPYLNYFTHNEDITQKLINILGIKNVSDIIFNRIRFIIDNGSTDLNYVDDKYNILYESSKVKILNSVKMLKRYVKVLEPNKWKFEDLFDNFVSDEALISNGINIELPTVYINIHDSNDDVGEDATFITDFLHPFMSNYSEYDSLYIHVYPRTMTVSFRSCERSNIDVSKIAKVLGGGGHKAASGVKLPPEIILTLLDAYYFKAKSLDDPLLNYYRERKYECDLFDKAVSAYMLTLPELDNFTYDK